MNDSLTKKEAISIVDCQVRCGRSGGSEIVLGQLTKVQPLPKKFNKAGLVSREAPIAVEMNDLCSLTANQQVTMTVNVKKVLKFREEELLKREKEVNEVKKVLEKEKMHEKDRGRHYRFERGIGQ